MKLSFHEGPADRVETGTLVVCQFEGERPLQGAVGEVDWRLHGWLSRLLIEGRLDGEYRSCVLIPANRLHAARVIILGVGDPNELGTRRLSELAETVRDKVAGLKEERLAVALPDRTHDDEEEHALWTRELHRSFVRPLMESGVGELTILGTHNLVEQIKTWTQPS